MDTRARAQLCGQRRGHIGWGRGVEARVLVPVVSDPAAEAAADLARVRGSVRGLGASQPLQIYTQGLLFSRRCGEASSLCWNHQQLR